MRAGIVAWLWSRLVTSVSEEKSLHIMWSPHCGPIPGIVGGTLRQICSWPRGQGRGKRAFRQVARLAQEQVGEGN